MQWSSRVVFLSYIPHKLFSTMHRLPLSCATDLSHLAMLIACLCTTQSRSIRHSCMLFIRQVGISCGRVLWHGLACCLQGNFPFRPPLQQGTGPCPPLCVTWYLPTLTAIKALCLPNVQWLRLQCGLRSKSSPCLGPNMGSRHGTHLPLSTAGCSGWHVCGLMCVMKAILQHCWLGLSFLLEGKCNMFPRVCQGCSRGLWLLLSPFTVFLWKMMHLRCLIECLLYTLCQLLPLPARGYASPLFPVHCIAQPCIAAVPRMLQADWACACGCKILLWVVDSIVEVCGRCLRCVGCTSHFVVVQNWIVCVQFNGVWGECGQCLAGLPAI